jgi:hypothetical protein
MPLLPVASALLSMSRLPCLSGGIARSRHSEQFRRDKPLPVAMRAFKDLREFLQLLEAEKQLLRISEEVRLEPDLAAGACALAQLGDAGPALQFDNISGYLQVKGRSKLAIQPIPQHDIAIHLTHAEERGKDLPVATTPIAPDRRGHYGEELDNPQRTDVWRKKLGALVKESQQ